MVFVLEDIAKIEMDRNMNTAIVDSFTYVQPSDVLRDMKTNDKIHTIMEGYVEAAQHYVWNSDIGDVLSVFTDSFLNAGMWGNKNISGKRIQVCIKYGLFGSVIYVEDEGQGFDYKAQIEKLQRGEQHDFSNNGGGLRKFHESVLYISYHGCGNKISIATRVSSQEELRDFLRSSHESLSILSRCLSPILLP